METAAKMQRYFIGFMIGMLVEYLIRQPFLIWPALILGCQVFILIIDLLHNTPKTETKQPEK